ncbi:hypothetical protein HanRHA438_Chr03g0149881 [Helianthus annuus]|nr:hypothetical protein HanRHA438_Chr03g0149881 [Helianthus annuus]
MFVAYLQIVLVNIASICDIVSSIASLSTLSFSFSANNPAIIPFSLSFSFSSSFSLMSSLMTKFNFSIYKTNNEFNQEFRINEN